MGGAIRHHSEGCPVLTPHVPDDMAELYLNDAAFHYVINALAASSDPTTVLQLVSRIRDQIPAFTRRGE